MTAPPSAAITLPTATELRAASAAGLTLHQWREAGCPDSPPQVRGQNRTRAKGAYRSALEASYANHLERQRLCGLILAWQYEPRRFTVGVRRRYRPDFRVVHWDAEYTREVELLVLTVPWGNWKRSTGLVVSYHEVKGSKHAKNARDSITRLHTVAMLYPHLRWALVTRQRGEWVLTPIEGKA